MVRKNLNIKLCSNSVARHPEPQSLPQPIARHPNPSNCHKRRCKKSISDNKPKHFTFPLVAIKSAVRLRIEGLSLERIRKVINRTFHVLIKSKTTIHYWCNWFLITCAAIFPHLGKLLPSGWYPGKNVEKQRKILFLCGKGFENKADSRLVSIEAKKQRCRIRCFGLG